MPLFNKFNPRLSNLHLWEITETEEGLINTLTLSESSNSRLNKLKSITQRKQFLSIQNLLKLLNLKSGDLMYNSYGKPKLLNGQCISISHSFDYCGK